MILSEQLSNLLEELIDDWGDGRLERVRDLVNAAESELAETKEREHWAKSALYATEAGSDGLEWRLQAAEAREAALREALELCNADHVRLDGCACVPEGKCYLHGVIVAKALASLASGEET